MILFIFSYNWVKNPPKPREFLISLVFLFILKGPRVLFYVLTFKTFKCYPRKQNLSICCLSAKKQRWEKSFLCPAAAENITEVVQWLFTPYVSWDALCTWPKIIPKTSQQPANQMFVSDNLTKLFLCFCLQDVARISLVSMCNSPDGMWSGKLGARTLKKNIYVLDPSTIWFYNREQPKGWLWPGLLYL